MTVRTGTVATIRPDRTQYLFDGETFDAVPLKSSTWRVSYHLDVDELTDSEKEAIVKKLDADDQEAGVLFGSSQEAIDSLRSRIKRPPV
jgi:hypothetical protein